MIAAGAVAGWFARPTGAASPSRPKRVEAVLAAHEKGDAQKVRDALGAAGLATAYESPWREEVRFVRAALESDWEDLRRLGHQGPAGAAAARALLFLSDRDPVPAERTRALDRLRSDYPRSWVVAARAKGGK